MSQVTGSCNLTTLARVTRPGKIRAEIGWFVLTAGEASRKSVT
jgi:hypothetical protein